MLEGQRKQGSQANREGKVRNKPIREEDKEWNM